MAKDQGVKSPAAPRAKPPAKLAPKSAQSVKSAVSATAARAPEPARPRPNLAQFAREVRAEARKITWTSWKETWITSVMVFIMVVVTATFFLVVDGSLSFIMQQLLKLAG